jgi:hypothetical protein
MVGLLVLVLIILGIIVLYQKANKASDGWLGTILIGVVLGLVFFFLYGDYQENHRLPEEPLGAVVGKILTDETYWDSSGIDPETCKWDRSMGLPCAVKVMPRYEAQSVVISVDPGSPAWAAGLQVGDFIQHCDNVECVDPDTDKGTRRDKASDRGRALARALNRDSVWVLRRPDEKANCGLSIIRPVSLNSIIHLAIRFPANRIAAVGDSQRQSTQAAADQLETTQRTSMAPLSQPPSYTPMPNPLADHGTSNAPKRTRDGLPSLPPLPDFRPMPDPLHGH